MLVLGQSLALEGRCIDEGLKQELVRSLSGLLGCLQALCTKQQFQVQGGRGGHLRACEKGQASVARDGGAFGVRARGPKGPAPSKGLHGREWVRGGGEWVGLAGVHGREFVLVGLEPRDA